MSWIKIISYDASKGKLRKLYNRVKGPDDNVDNIMLAHGLRPHSMTGHMTLYKNVLHHKDNTLSKIILETIGVYVSHLNDCEYCVKHHFEGLKRHLKDDTKATSILEAFQEGNVENGFSDKEQAMLKYSKKLTLNPNKMREEDINDLREIGFDDGEILEINQVVAYFNYANRTVLGLGVNTKGDILGLSPNDDNSEDNWGHR
jgi:uncharacterized peroxidase-related enzyme